MYEKLRALVGRVKLIYMLLFRPLEITQENLETHGDIVNFSLIGSTYALIGNPDLLKLLVNHVQWNLARAQSYLIQEELSPAQELIPGFLQFSDGSFHRTLRTLGSTQYTPSRHHSFTRSLLTNYTNFLDGLKDTRGINLSESIKEIVYNTVCHDTFGIQLDPEQINQLLKARRLSSNTYRLYRIFGADVTRWYSPLALAYRKSHKANSFMIDHSLSGARSCPLSNNFLSCFDSSNDSIRTHPLGDKQFIDDLNGYLAASESVSITVHFAVLALLSSPEYLQKVRDEATEAFLDSTICTPDVNRLEYTRAVVLETLRLYPPFPFLEKHISESMIISGHRLEPKTILLVSLYSIHRHEAFHESALDFIPDRWHDNYWGIDPDLRYIPFGFGHTKCIAWQQSLISITVLVARIILDFKLTPTTAFSEYSPSTIPSRFEGVNLLPKHLLHLDLRDSPS